MVIFLRLPALFMAIFLWLPLSFDDFPAAPRSLYGAFFAAPRSLYDNDSTFAVLAGGPVDR